MKFGEKTANQINNNAIQELDVSQLELGDGAGPNRYGA